MEPAPAVPPPPVAAEPVEDDPFAAGPPRQAVRAGSPAGAVAVLRGPGAETLPLQPGDRVVVGRSPDSPLSRLCPDNISFLHAEIYVDGQAVVVVDTRSTNGTFVDEQRLAPSVPRVLTRTARLRLANDPPLLMTIEMGDCR